MNFRTPLNAIMNSYKFIESTLDQMHDNQKNSEPLTPPAPMASIKKKKTHKSTDLQAKMKKFIMMGSNSSVLLLNLIDDILDLSKMEGGTFTVNPTEFVLEEAIRECYDIFYFQCILKKIELNLEIDPEINNLIVYSDSGRIKQALLNLLSNAFKFTFEGFIKISARITSSEKTRFIELEVEDTGVGIKDKDQKKLFKYFGMVDSQKSKNPTGSGIGLTVTKKYVEHLDGQISLTSKFGEGTKVSIRLPLIKIQKQQEKRLISTDLPTVGIEYSDNSDDFLDNIMSTQY